VRAAALLVVAAAGLAPEGFAAVYTCTDAQGRTVFQDVPCGKARAPVDMTKPRRGTQKEESASQEPLERKRVESVLKRLHQAMTKRDAKAVVALLAEDVEVEWVFSKGQRGEPALDRGAYAEYLRKVFGHPDYVYERKSERVSLAKRKPRATVTRTLREAVLVNDRLQIADVSERLTIEPDGRRLVVRSVRKTAALGGRNAPAKGAVLPSRQGERRSAAPVLLAQDDQHDQYDDPGGHRDIQH
jgi:hypothetical protein